MVCTELLCCHAVLPGLTAQGIASRMCNACAPSYVFVSLCASVLSNAPFVCSAKHRKLHSQG